MENCDCLFVPNVTFAATFNWGSQPTTYAVELTWNPVPNATAYAVHTNINNTGWMTQTVATGTPAVTWSAQLSGTVMQAEVVAICSNTFGYPTYNLNGENVVTHNIP